MSRDFFLENAAYVPQEDRLWSALTVRENLFYSCKLHNPNLSASVCDSRVDEVLGSLGLVGCQHTKIGNVFLKGVSGGQKRRTPIGMELVADRKVLFLDEPTSGLDAASAAEIMALLKRLAVERGVAIITSVHQPSTHVFNSFDQCRTKRVPDLFFRSCSVRSTDSETQSTVNVDGCMSNCSNLSPNVIPACCVQSTFSPLWRNVVILLTMGQTAFFGPASEALQYFAGLGLKPTGLVNPADYLLEITNSDFSDATVVQDLANSWKTSSANATLMSRIVSANPPSIPRKPSQGLRAGLLRLFTLVKRAGQNSARDPAAYAFRLVLYVFMSCFLGSVYYRVDNNQEDLLNRAFLILWMNAFNSYMDMAAIPVFSLEKEAVVKEFQNGQYSVGIYCLATAVVQTLL
ncbi:unnamed protein product [Choristocarpus tenellus]